MDQPRPEKRRGLTEDVVVTETRTYYLITSTACPVCSFFVDVDALGLLGVMVGAASDLTPESAAVLKALGALWAANRKAFGLCGHQVTIDAADLSREAAQATP